MRVLAKASEIERPVHRRSEFLSPTETYEVTPGATYCVAGVGVFLGELCVLIDDDAGRPDWPPAALFDVVDESIPGDWTVRVLGDDDPESGGWSLRLGYSELVDSLDHVNGLIEHEREAMEVHYRATGTITPPQT